MVEITPEIQKQLDEQKKNCIFCKIISGEMKSQIVYKDKHLVGALDINPAVKGHMLLMTKEHYPIMPYIPGDVFKHYFGMVGQLLGAIQKSLLFTGSNVFIANGGVAGQQSPHFLIHLLGREKGDKINFDFSKAKPVEETKISEAHRLLANNVPIMMRNHFGRNPAKWHDGNVKTGDHLIDLKASSKIVYEDEKAFAVMSSTPQCLGHIEIYAQEGNDITTLDVETISHLFFVASFCATGVFEGLGAHGTNIILKNGKSGDNMSGNLSIHVLPRYEGDGLDLMWKPLSTKPNMDSVASKLRGKMFVIEESLKPKKKAKVIDLSSSVEQIVVGDGNKLTKKELTPDDEISSAIAALKKK